VAKKNGSVVAYKLLIIHLDNYHSQCVLGHECVALYRKFM